MTAKKTAARNPVAAKQTKTKTSARKAVTPSTAKAAPKRPEKAAPAVKAVAKPAIKAAKAPVPKPVEKRAVAAKKPAAAARAKPSPSASFDPDRRLELIAAAAAARRRKTTSAKQAPAPIAITPQREPSPVERHRFSVGDQVRVISTSGMWFKHGIDYRVTAALPPQAGKLQYRIKNEQEPFERVVSESQLASAQAPAAHAQF